MSLNVNYNITYGEVRVKNRKNDTYVVKIHHANCLCAFIHHYKNDFGVHMASLWMFITDVATANRIIKNSTDHTLLGTDVVSVKLNVYYKEARELIIPMCKSGYKVSCYYKEPKNNNK